jgi:hypothetical protein
MPWDKPVESFMVEVEEQTTKLVRSMVLYAFKGISSASPIKDGQYRGNHNIGLRVIDPKTTSPNDKSGSATLSRAIRRLSKSEPYPVIFISNGLPYADALENGHSGQALLGVYGVSFNSMLARFEHEF